MMHLTPPHRSAARNLHNSLPVQHQPYLREARLKHDRWAPRLCPPQRGTLGTAAWRPRPCAAPQWRDGHWRGALYRRCIPCTARGACRAGRPSRAACPCTRSTHVQHPAPPRPLPPPQSLLQPRRQLRPASRASRPPRREALPRALPRCACRAQRCTLRAPAPPRAPQGVPAPPQPPRHAPSPPPAAPPAARPLSRAWIRAAHRRSALRGEQRVCVSAGGCSLVRLHTPMIRHSAGAPGSTVNLSSRATPNMLRAVVRLRRACLMASGL